MTDCWLNLHEYGIEDYCDECENYILSLENYNICNICGNVCKDNICNNHNIIFDNIDSLISIFTKNSNDEKCKYCHRYLIKCKMCENSCYVCVFKDCSKSKLNGLKLEYYSYLCKEHSIGAINEWTKGNVISKSNIICEDCGTNESFYKPSCNCLGLNKINLCINCHDVDYAMYRLYCYQCT